MSLNRQEWRLAVVVACVLLVGSTVLLCRRANPRMAADLRTLGGSASNCDPDGPLQSVETTNKALAAHLERVSAKMDGTAPVEARGAGAPVRRINLNTAGEAELMLLNGIGPKRAQAIVRRRKEIGGFRTLEDLQRVEGIGPVTLERIAPWVCLESEDPPDRAD